LIQVGHSDLGVYHKKNDICLVESQNDLFIDLLFKNIVTVGDISTGIDD
jgi:hypothetical protein